MSWACRVVLIGAPFVLLVSGMRRRQPHSDGGRTSPPFITSRKASAFRARAARSRRGVDRDYAAATTGRPARTCCRAPCLVGELFDALAQLLPELLVHEPAGLEPRRRMPDGELGVEHASARGRQDLAQLRLRPDRAEDPAARADDRDGLVAERIHGERPRKPVDSVLQLARNRRVVLGRAEEDRVGAGDVRAQSRDGRRRRVDVVVLVVRGHRLQAVPQLELDVAGRELGRCAQQVRVVGLAAQAARDGENLHARPPSRTAGRRRS